MDSVKTLGRSTGGVPLQSQWNVSTQAPLEIAPIPSELIVPLEAGLSVRDIRPAIQTGQRVLRGQPLVEGGGPLTLWTHATTSGFVRSLETRPVIHPRRREALCAVIEPDGEDETWAELAPPDPTQWDTPEKLSNALSNAGIAGLGGAVFPTGVKLAAGWRHGIREVVINGAECDPDIACDEALMQTSPREVLAGALALVELSGAERGYLVLETNMQAAIEALERELPALGGDERLSLVSIPAKYPAGSEKQLIQMLTGYEVPPLAHPTDIGYLCQNVGTTVALFRFLKYGYPVTSRITTVTGNGVKRQRNLEVRFGTPIADVIDACGGYADEDVQLIMGGTMMGIAVENDRTPITRAANCIVAAIRSDLSAKAEAALPCIRCGECARVCPSYLLPQELYRATEQKQSDALDNLGLFDCIECGCCDVVCPSRIPLTESFRSGKRQFMQSMDLPERARWFDEREQLRSEYVRRWEEKHELDEETRKEQRTHQQNLEAVAELIANLSHAAERAEE